MKKKVRFHWSMVLLCTLVLAIELIITANRTGDLCIDYAIVGLSLPTLYGAFKKIRKKPSG